jgi:radical SAM-linked protein
MTEEFPPERRQCVIIEFTKSGPLRFLSHLDLARVMDRAVRRAKIPVSHSEGFHPHAKISFAMPLPLGMEGRREPCLIELARPASTPQMASALGRCLPRGMELVSMELTSRGRRSPLADLQIAGYAVELLDPEQLPALTSAVAKLLAAEAWRILRPTKSQVAEVDLRPGLLRLALLPEPRPRLEMELSLAPESLVKPEEVMRALAELAGLPAVTTGRTARTHLR